ncbi:MAG: MFS transporter [Pirellulaceae bacterium]
MGIDTKTYIALSVVMFLEYAVWGAWAPVLAARLLGPLKMTGKQTGWIYATLPMACIVSPLVAGWLADQYVDMKWILIAAHLMGAVLLFVAAKQTRFVPLLAVMFLYSLCFAATMPLVNAVLFREVTDGAVQAKVFIWAPLAWALVGWALTGWRVTRKTTGDGSDCLHFAAALSIVMALGCFMLEAKELPATGKIPVVEALGMLTQMNFLLFIVISMVIAGLMQFYFLGSAQFMQDRGVSSGLVPASMALAQVAQAAATWYLLTPLINDVGYKWTLVIGATCWLVLYAIYVIGKPGLLVVACQPLHGLAYVFFIIAGQMCANFYAKPEIVGSMQALIFAATVGVGLFVGTQFAGIVMDKNSVEGKFQWPKVWIVPCVITLIGVLVLAALFQNPAVEQKPAPNADAPVSARDA